MADGTPARESRPTNPALRRRPYAFRFNSLFEDNTDINIYNKEGTPSLPSIYGLFRGADWQERETFDMFGIHFDGHPHPKRLLMPEDWKGWPLRKDYVQPDFYEMQDAY